MAIELIATVQGAVPAVPEVVILDGWTRIEASAHDKVKIKVAGDDLLDISVPAGKVWEVRFAVHIRETNA
jgi:hypothetical protein